MNDRLKQIIKKITPPIFLDIFRRKISMFKFLKRLFNKPNWKNLLCSTKPVSKVFSFDRVVPSDRVYIEKFIQDYSKYIQDIVLEIADDNYSKKYGRNIIKYEILDTTKNNLKATIIGDLTDVSMLPKNKTDCFIYTQTLNFVYNFQDAIKSSYYLLKKGGIILAIVAGISQISRYDMNRWGDYWRFTPLSIQKAFTEVFAKDNIKVYFYGNVLSAISFLEGLAGGELTKEELDYKAQTIQ